MGPLLHFFATLMVCLGAHFSAIWIVVANSWMQTPAGFHIANHGLGPRAEVTDFWAMVFNPSTVERLMHTVLGAWQAGAFLVVSVSAYYLLKGKFEDFARRSLVGKALSRPDLVKQVVHKLRQEGPLPTYRTVMNRLDSPQPLGYSCAGVVAEVGAGVVDFAPGDRVACAGAGYARHYRALPPNQLQRPRA